MLSLDPLFQMHKLRFPGTGSDQRPGIGSKEFQIQKEGISQKQ